MGFRKHFTKEEKYERRMNYRLLKNAGLTTDSALRVRDWTDNKIMMVALGDCHPAGVEYT